MRKLREILFIILLLPTALMAQNTYYVSSSEGSDSNSGTSSSQPWKTLSNVNQKTFSPGDQILFKRGDKWEGTITVTSSGSSSSPIVYGAYGSGDKPKIYGSKAITGWTVHSGNIYKASFSEQIEQLFVDAKRMSLARHPNSGYLTTTSTNGSTTVTSNELDGSINYSGAYWIGRTTPYNMYSRKVASSSSQTITLSSSRSGIGTGEGFILTNKMDFVDQEGEWYYDASSRTVYLYTTNSPSNYEIRGSIYDNGVSIKDRNHIVVKELEFAHQASHGIYVDNGDYIKIDGNQFSYAEQNGILFPNSGSSNATITNNVIFGSSITGITSYAPNSVISDNTVYDIGLLENFHKNVIDKVGTGIYTRADDCKATYNHVERCGYVGLKFYGQRNMIKYNYINQAMAVLSDGGGIYTYNGSDYSKPASAGSEVMYNIVLNCQGNREGYTKDYDDGYGIYMDDRTHDVKIHYNTISGANCGIYLHIAGNIDVRYNNISDCNAMAVNSGEEANSYYYDNIFYAFDEIDNFIWWNGDPQRFVKEDGASAVFDRNTYINHYNSTDIFNNSSEWESWRSSSRDANSTFDNSALADGEYEKLFYNNTKQSKVINLGDGSYKDIYGKTVSGSITLEPYTSKILIVSKESSTATNQSPAIDNQVFSVTAPVDANTLIGQVVASDADQTQTLSYSVVQGNEDGLFSLNPETGDLLANKTLNPTADQTINLTVMVSDDAATPLSATATVTVHLNVSTASADATALSISSFSIPTTYSSLTVPISDFTTTDDNSVSGYLVTSSNTTPSLSDEWQLTAPKSYTFSSEGSYTLYAWVKDASDNISSPESGTVNIALAEISPNYSAYLFEETSGTSAIDTEGGNDGTIVNEVNRVSGAKGSGLEFTGSGYVNLGPGFSTNIQNEVTLSTWIKPSALATGYQGVIMHGGPNLDSFALYIKSDDNSIGFKTSGTSNAWTSVSNISSLWDGEWHHLAVTYDGNQKIVYLDNQVLTTVSASGVIESGEGYNLLIGAGRDEVSPTLLYQGQIDEVRIYNTALSSSEIASLYNDINSSADTNQAPQIADQSFDVLGDISVDDVIGQIVANDPNSGQSLNYSITQGNTDGLFAVDPATGTIYAKSSLLTTTDQTIILIVQVSDNDAVNPLSSEATISINIRGTAINHSPIISDQTFSLPSGLAVNDLIGEVVASDPDEGQTISYSIIQGNEAGLFSIDAATGELFLQASLPADLPETITLTVEVKDNAEKPLTAYADVLLTSDKAASINQQPTIADQSFEITTQLEANDLVGKIVANDSDAGQTLSYAITTGNEDGFFSLNPATGELFANKTITLESNLFVTLTVQVTDDSSSPLSANASVTVQTAGQINQAPVAEDLFIEIEGNIQMDDLVGQVVASDPNLGQVLNFSIIQGNEEGLFSIDSSTGEIFASSSVITTADVLHTFVVGVTDNAISPLTTEANVTISITALAINHRPVVDDQVFEVRKNDRVGDLVGQVIASDPDAGQSLTYAILQGNEQGYFQMNPATGEIFSTSSISLNSSQSINLIVEVTDDAANSLSASANVTIDIVINGKIVKGEVSNGNPKRIVLYYEEPLQSNTLKSTQIASDFTLSGDKIVQNVSIVGNEIHLDIDSQYGPDEEILVSYYQGPTPIYDVYGNEVESFEDFYVDNNLAESGMTTDVDPEFNTLDVSFFPNPSNGIINVRANNLTADDCELSVYSLMGSMVSKKQLSASFGSLEEKVNMSHLNKGTYIVQLVCNTQVYQTKIIIM